MLTLDRPDWKNYEFDSIDKEILAAVTARRGEYRGQRNSVVVDDQARMSKRKGGALLRYNAVCRASMGDKSGRRFLAVLRMMGVTNCVELGTCGGISSMYLYGALMANAAARGLLPYYIGIEGCPVRVQLTRQSVADVSQRLASFNVPAGEACVVEGRFEEHFDPSLTELGDPQFVYIDGEHLGGSLEKYFNMAAAKMTRGVIAADDLTYSRSMRVAGQRLVGHPAVTDWFNVTGSKRFYVIAH